MESELFSGWSLSPSYSGRILGAFFAFHFDISITVITVVRVYRCINDVCLHPVRSLVAFFFEVYFRSRLVWDRFLMATTGDCWPRPFCFICSNILSFFSFFIFLFYVSQGLPRLPGEVTPEFGPCSLCLPPKLSGGCLDDHQFSKMV